MRPGRREGGPAPGRCASSHHSPGHCGRQAQGPLRLIQGGINAGGVGRWGAGRHMCGAECAQKNKIVICAARSTHSPNSSAFARAQKTFPHPPTQPFHHHHARDREFRSFQLPLSGLVARGKGRGRGRAKRGGTRNRASLFSTAGGPPSFVPLRTRYPRRIAHAACHHVGRLPARRLVYLSSPPSPRTLS